MRKRFILVLVSALVVLGGAFAQEQETPTANAFPELSTYIEGVEKLVATDDEDLELTAQQAETLLPYLREVRALTSLTPTEAAFYTEAIRRELSDAQLEVVVGEEAAAETPQAAAPAAPEAVETATANPFVQDNALAGSLYDLILELSEVAETGDGATE